jgi:hypothetical protein
MDNSSYPVDKEKMEAIFKENNINYKILDSEESIELGKIRGVFPNYEGSVLEKEKGSQMTPQYILN